ncbi:hypothetical protein [Ornithinimicrobium tianjinense]|uniref:Uncharacterized protein n=1 Tax=Ornithinimicrobium tianjinense TaxID=1195761 RepID=A0A917BNJ1_9MICO|nr:hypothetical protein [Ornithinimicrobium tianjinense]GGF51683.1 hypothetical protein GCM10011366_19410 [Ornithinimicrobium tianjinense]
MASAHDLARLLTKGDRLGFFAHLDDRLWEIVGGGPQGWRHRLESVALNPQPLPPEPPEIGQRVMLAMARGIIVVGGREESAVHAFWEDLEDWCGTGWPRRWPFPWPDPWPDPRLDPRADRRPEILVGAALTATALAARYPEGEMRDLFDAAGQRLMDAALG